MPFVLLRDSEINHKMIWSILAIIKGGRGADVRKLHADKARTKTKMEVIASSMNVQCQN